MRGKMNGVTMVTPDILSFIKKIYTLLLSLYKLIYIN